MAILRAGDIGSISAWLPSRRSVDSQRGAWVMVAFGQVRSARSIGGKARYRWYGIGLGCCWWFARCRVMALSQSGGSWSGRDEEAPQRGFPAVPSGRVSLAAAAKKEAASRHDQDTVPSGRTVG